MDVTKLCGWKGNNTRIHQYETAMRTPTIRNLYKIANALQCSASELLGED